MNYVNRTRLYR